MAGRGTGSGPGRAGGGGEAGEGKCLAHHGCARASLSRERRTPPFRASAASAAHSLPARQRREGVLALALSERCRSEEPSSGAHLGREPQPMVRLVQVGAVQVGAVQVGAVQVGAVPTSGVSRSR